MEGRSVCHGRESPWWPPLQRLPPVQQTFQLQIRLACEGGKDLLSRCSEAYFDGYHPEAVHCTIGFSRSSGSAQRPSGRPKIQAKNQFSAFHFQQNFTSFSGGISQLRSQSQAPFPSDTPAEKVLFPMASISFASSLSGFIAETLEVCWRRCCFTACQSTVQTA